MAAPSAASLSGTPIPYAIVVYARLGSANSGTNGSAATAIASSSGAFTLTLDATNDAGTAPLDPDEPNVFASYRVPVIAPRSGEHVVDADVTIPNSPTTINLAQLLSNPI